MRGMRLGILLASIVLVSGSAHAATVAVNNAAGCSDITGTPFCTINKAILAASNGDTIQIAAGTYAGTIASFSKPLTFIGSGSGANGTVITKSMTYTGTGPLAMSNLRIQGGGSNLKVGGTGNFSGLMLSGAAFIGNGTGAHGVFIKQNGSVSDVTVINCTFNGHGQSGFLIQRGTGPVTNVDNIDVSGSTFAGNGEYGFRSDPRTTNLYIADSNITNNAIDGFLLLNADGATLDTVTITGNRNGILLIPLAATDAISNVTLTNVTVNHNTRFISGQYGSGMTLSGNAGSISQITATGSSFSGNTIHGVATSGAVSQVSIGCSVIEGNGQNGVREASTPSAAVKAEHVYWGCATGANTTGCSTVSGNVDHLPYRSTPEASCPVMTALSIVPPAVTLAQGESAALTAQATMSDGTTVDVTTQAEWHSSNTAVVTVSAAGVITAVAPGSATITASVDGFTATATITIGAAQTLPPNPRLVAPPNDPSKITTVYDSTRFLYEGTPPIQTGVAPDAIDRVRAAVVRGRVFQRGGQPLTGVTISFAGEPQYGQTLSRADGGFDLAVNGGGLLTLQYRKAGYLALDRQVEPEWDSWRTADDAVMIPYDSAVTTIDLTAPGTQLHRGTTTVDSDGTRTAVVIFQPGTTATMTMPDGSTQPLPSMALRATEYTIGAEGPQTMPAALPPQSGYTYCVELSADEAVVAGAKSVELSKPAALYVDNFIGFGAGTVIPVGLYDRTCRCWVGSTNGRVVMVVAIEGGRAYLDSDGDGDVDDTDTELGTTIEERTRIASLYTLGKTVWRAPMPHFTPVDLNWPFRWGYNYTLTDSPEDATNPGLDPWEEVGTPDDTCEIPGSVIECESQVLGEDIAVVGAPFMLSYRSSRVPGRAVDRSTLIPLSKDSIPDSVLRIELTVDGVGERPVKKTFPRGTDITDDFEWDGKDPYGRQVQGRTSASVRVGYVYERFYSDMRVDGWRGGAMWGQQGFRPDTRTVLARRREEFQQAQSWSKTLTQWDARGIGLGGWTPSIHHTYDHTSKTIQYGNGRRSRVDASPSVISSIGGSNGSGARRISSQDSGPLLESPRSVLAMPDGGTLIGDGNGRIYRADRKTGALTLFAGNGTTEFNGDDIDAKTAGFFPADLALGPDNSVYIADESNGRVRRILNGIITTVAGDGLDDTPFVEYSPATTQSIRPQGVAVHSDGSIYIADRTHSRIWRVMCDGALTIYAGNGQTVSILGDPMEGTPIARDRPLPPPSYVAVDKTGRVYATVDGNAVYRIDTEGMLSRIAEAEVTFEEYGQSVPVAAGGLTLIGNSLYRANPTQGSVLAIRTDGVSGSRRVLGGSFSGSSGDGGAAADALLAHPSDVAFANGKLFVADPGSARVRVVQGVLPGTGDTGDSTNLPAEDGSEIYVFDSDGRHLKTVDTLTGQALFTFAYEETGQLKSVTDLYGLVTRIERDGNGKPTAIVTPGEKRTGLQLQANDYLSSITNPANEGHQFTYDDGLLRSMTDPRSKTYTFDYDNKGRAIIDRDPAGGFTTLTREGTPDQYTVTRQTAEGRSVTHSVNQGKEGERERIVSDDVTGMSQTSHRDKSGNISLNASDGSSSTRTLEASGRFGMLAPIVQTSTSPALGYGLSIRRFDSVILSTPDDPLSPVESFQETVEVNGRPWTMSFDAATRVSESTSPTGRSSRTTFDVNGNVERVEVPGFAPVTYRYTPSGQMEEIEQSGRRMQFQYDSKFRLISVVDALSRTARFEYDDAERITKQVLPGSREVRSEHDAAGNVLSLTPPSRSPHAFVYSPVNLDVSYDPPSGSSTEYEYDRDRKLRLLRRADGSTIEMSYDGSGRPVTVTVDRGRYSFEYDGSTGRTTLGTSPDGISVAYSYDGPGLTAMHWSGAVSGSVQLAYDSDLVVGYETVCDAMSTCDAREFTYDNDKLLIGVGALQITRDSLSGSIMAAAAGTVSDIWSYNSLGEPTLYEINVADAPLFKQEYTRDDGGRIVTRRETVEGVVTLWEYSYDSASRLYEVRRDGALVGHYEYDPNGNRTVKAVSGHEPEIASCDGQDRLLTQGAASFAYTATGDIESRTDSAGTASYVYDEVGNLIRATKPDGTIIDYVMDAEHRRVGRKVAGVTTHQWLYDAQSRIVAELDAEGALVSRFIYGVKRNVPDHFVRGGDTYRIISDHLGSPRLIVSINDGSIVQRIDYDEFGNVVADSNPGFQPFGFAGGLHDRDTGLVTMGAREYDPQTGRFVTKDPIGFAGSDANLYAYVMNDPINLMDPMGTDWVETTANFSAGFGDALLLGFGDELREWTDQQFGWSGGALVDKCSGAYSAGEWTGIAASTLAGGAAGAGARGLRLGMSRPNVAFPRGIEWVERSHWIAKFKGTRVDGAWNMQRMWGTEHALADPARYRFLPRWWKAANPLPGPVSRQIARVPDWARGAAGGGAYGGTGAALSGVGCGCN